MKRHATVGDYYAHLLQEHLNAAIEKKLAETSAFKKKLAGIETVEDAIAKGYAPSPAQVVQVKACISRHANERYIHERFRQLPAKAATGEFIAALMKDIAAINGEWRKNRQFSFDQPTLDELAQEAEAIVAAEHDAAKQHFYG